MNGNTTLQASDDLDEAPVWSPEDFAQAVHRVGLQPTPNKKQKINITLDPDVVAWFKQQAGGRGYQTLINGLCIPRKLDTHSTPNWTLIPRQTGQSERSDAG
jgi:uncharacterized protein (DUF4415 family)